MSTGNLLAGTLWNVVRFAFLLLLIALVLLFILAKSGKDSEEEGKGEESEVVQEEVSEGEFGKGWTDLKYRVKYHWTGGNLDYELFVHPYDRRIEQLRKTGNELVLLSFVNAERDRVFPRKSPARIEMRDLEPVMVEDEEGKK